MSESLIPSDPFSTELRRVKANLAALGAGSTIHARDFYGNNETWIVETYRLDDGSEVVFLQRVSAAGGDRWVLRPEVTAALARHRDQLTAKSRRRAARTAVATKRANGQAVGNPAALQQARRRRLAGQAGRS